MTALSAARKTRSKLNNGDRYRIRVVASGETIFPGAMVGLDSSGLAEAATATSPQIDGWADPDTTVAEGAVAGETVRVLEGEAYWENGASLVQADAGKVAYPADDQTVTDIKGAGEAPPVGVITEVNDIGVLVQISRAVNTALLKRPVTQRGTATLASGTVTIDTTIELRTGAQILISLATRPTVTTVFAGIAVVARTDGAKATAAFTIESIVAAGTIDTTTVADVHWSIVG